MNKAVAILIKKEVKLAIMLVGALALILSLAIGLFKTNPVVAGYLNGMQVNLTTTQSKLSVGQTGEINFQLKSASGKPMSNQWVALYLPQTEMRSDRYSHNGFFTLDGKIAFQKTNADGGVIFRVASDKVGEVIYQAAVGQVDRNNQASYQMMPNKVSVTYE